MTWTRQYKRWYDPRALLSLVVAVPVLLIRYCHAKYKSVTARRWALKLQLGQAMQHAIFIAEDESLPLSRRRDAVRTLRKLVRMSDELGIENDTIESYSEQYDNLKEIL